METSAVKLCLLQLLLVGCMWSSTLSLPLAAARIKPCAPSNASTACAAHCAYLDRHGACVCAPDQSPDADGACHCLDPALSLHPETYLCTCDPSYCPEQPDCEGGTAYPRPSSNASDCCQEWDCVSCPADSLLVAVGGAEGAEPCQCAPCPPRPQCAETVPDLPRLVEKGRGEPGHCCDLYQCPAVQECQEGVTWPKEGETCVECRCSNGITLCDHRPDCEVREPETGCSLGGHAHSNGSAWFEDPCTHCRCLNGSVSCLAHFCEGNVGSAFRPTCDQGGGLQTCQLVCEWGYRVDAAGCPLCECLAHLQVGEVPPKEEAEEGVEAEAGLGVRLGVEPTMEEESTDEVTYWSVVTRPTGEPQGQGFGLQRDRLIWVACISSVVAVAAILGCCLGRRLCHTSAYHEVAQFDNNNRKSSSASAKSTPAILKIKQNNNT